MVLTRLYGKNAVVFHDGKTHYISQNGFVDLPHHLVDRALRVGFNRNRPTDFVEPGHETEIPVGAAPVAIAPGTAAPALETGAAPEKPETPAAPAIQLSGLPVAHPQRDQDHRIASKEAIRDREARLRGQSAAPAATVVTPPTEPVPNA